METLKKLMAIGLLCGLAQTASAVPTTWVDPIDFNPDVHLTTWTGFNYQHDITDNGFQAGTDEVYSYTLAVNLYDDAYCQDGWELALVDLPGLFGDRLFFDLSGNEYGGWSFEGHAELESTGKLNVTIDSLWGDFFVGSSTLTVRGNSVSAPEPATLSMMGLGLLGIAGALRRKNFSV